MEKQKILEKSLLRTNISDRAILYDPRSY